MSRYWLILTFLLVVMIEISPTIAQDDERSRLWLMDASQRPLGVFTLQEDILYGAQGQFIFKMPLYGTRAYTIVAKTPISGAVVDIQVDLDSSQVVALTEKGVYRFDADTLELRNFIAGGGTTLDVHNNYWAVASHEMGIRIYEGQNLLKILTLGDAFDVQWLNDEQLAVADRINGLQFITDVPSEMPSSMIGIKKIVMDASNLYALDEHHVITLSASSLSQPQEIGFYAPVHQPLHLLDVNEWRIIADENDGIKVYDQDWHYYNSQNNSPSLNVAIDPTGRWLFNMRSRQLEIYNARRLPNLVLDTTIPLWANPHRVRFTTDGLALVTLQEGGIAVLDLEKRQVVHALPFSGPVVDVLPMSAAWAVLQGDGRLLFIGYDPKNPSDVSVYADLDVAGQPYQLARDGELLLVASGRAGLHVFDMKNIRSPFLLDTLPAYTNIKAIEVVSAGWLIQDGQQLRLYSPEVQKWSIEQFVPNLLTMQFSSNGVYTINENEIAFWQLNGDQFVLKNTYQTIHQLTDIAAEQELVLLGSEHGAILLDMRRPRRLREYRIVAEGLGVIKHVSIHGKDLIISDGQQLIHFSLQHRGTDEIEFTELGRFVVEENSSTETFEIPISLVAKVPSSITVYAQVDQDIWLGTVDGQLWEVEPNTEEIVLRGQVPSSILNISSSADPSILLVSSGENGLFWFDRTNGQTIRRVEITTLDAVTDPSGKWLALARGRCGLQIYQADNMTLVASDQTGIVSEVSWDSEGIHVMLDGLSALYGFDPEMPMPQPSILLQPDHMTSNALHWRSSADGCVPVQYEVWINQKKIGTTAETLWPLLNAQSRQFTWSIVAVDAFGNRSQSGLWLFEGDQVGWLMRAQQYQLMMQKSSETETTMPVWFVGVGLLLLGILGLWMFVRFWQFQT